MSRFKVAKPNNEVRLRNWEPGRVAQLKLFLGHLEQVVNTSLGAQVSQSPKRKFSEFVPVVPFQDIRTEVAFREIRLEFTPPRGLKDLLFYEFQISETEQFFQFDQFTSPNPAFVFSGLLDSLTLYIRVRVVTNNGFVGPFSVPVEATTPFAQGYGLYDGTQFQSLMSSKNEGYLSVYERDYTAIGGKVYYSIDYEIEVQRKNLTDKNLEWADVEFRWVIDNDQSGDSFLVTVYATNSSTVLGGDLEARTADHGDFNIPGSFLFLPGAFTLKRRGTFVQKFTTIPSGDLTIKLQARVVNKHPTPNDWIFHTASELPAPATTEVEYGSNVIVTLKNFNIFETLVN